MKLIEGPLKKKLLFWVALAIFYVMPPASLLMPSGMWLILALKIIVWTIFTGLVSHPNGN